MLYEVYDMANESLHKAKTAKNDEFYTRLTDVAEELRHYKKHFRERPFYVIVMIQHGLHFGSIFI